MIAVYVRMHQYPVCECVLGCKVGVCLYQYVVVCDDMMLLVDEWRGQCIILSLVTELSSLPKVLDSTVSLPIQNSETNTRQNFDF
jgi:hypothetical protein